MIQPVGIGQLSDNKLPPNLLLHQAYSSRGERRKSNNSYYIKSITCSYNPTPLSSPLKPLPKPDLRDLLIQPTSVSFKPVPIQCFPRRISTDLPHRQLISSCNYVFLRTCN